jgi:mannose-6-phosphate isomerase-like protein (cupin superfamily)
MLISRKDTVKEPFVSATGEQVYEMIGRRKELGGATLQSLGHSVIPPNGCSRPHYHPSSEETYYVLKGEGRMVVDGRERVVRPGDAILISPPEKHQIFASSTDDLEFLVVCAPAWEPTNSVYLDQ